MTQEEKQLLLKDLCARLPYGVTCHVENDSDHEGILQPYDCKLSFGLLDKFRGHQFELKPYLRPMSSMTEEEKGWYHLYGTGCTTCSASCAELVIDWLNSHHFDYRGLIEKGLALEAPEGMYKTE